MRTGCRILDRELAVSTGPGPMEIEVGEALPGGRKFRQKCRMANAEGLQGRSLFFVFVFFCKEALSTPPSFDCTLSFSSPAPKTAVVI